MTFNTETFFQAYVACALWASVDEAGEPLDGRDDEIAEETRAQMRADCEAFCESNRASRTGRRWRAWTRGSAGTIFG
jgi:hypothetical protein